MNSPALTMADRDIAAITAAALQLPPLQIAPETAPPGTHCAMTGAPLDTGYTIASITTTATNEFLDTFRGDAAGWVSEAVGRLFRQDHNLGSLLAIADGPAYKPLVSRASAREQNRPCWSDLIERANQLHNGAVAVCIVTSDTKKRLWPRARPAPVGPSAHVYFHDSGSAASASIPVDWDRLITTTRLIENAMNRGFRKFTIAGCLYCDPKAVGITGFPAATALERELIAARRLPEFPIALFIAQAAQSHSEEKK